MLTSIFKEPVERRLRVSSLNFEGDEQSDLTVHGGVDKAVCRLAVPPQLRVGCHPSRRTTQDITEGGHRILLWGRKRRIDTLNRPAGISPSSDAKHSERRS